MISIVCKRNQRRVDDDDVDDICAGRGFDPHEWLTGHQILERVSEKQRTALNCRRARTNVKYTNTNIKYKKKQGIRWENWCVCVLQCMGVVVHNLNRIIGRHVCPCLHHCVVLYCLPICTVYTLNLIWYCVIWIMIYVELWPQSSRKEVAFSISMDGLLAPLQHHVNLHLTASSWTWYRLGSTNLVDVGVGGWVEEELVDKVLVHKMHTWLHCCCCCCWTPFNSLQLCLTSFHLIIWNGDQSRESYMNQLGWIFAVFAFFGKRNYSGAATGTIQKMENHWGKSLGTGMSDSATDRKMFTLGFDLHLPLQ